MRQKSKGEYNLFHQRAILNPTNKGKIHPSKNSHHNEPHLFKQFIKKNKPIIINNLNRDFIGESNPVLITHNEVINNQSIIKSPQSFNFRPQGLKLWDHQNIEFARPNLEFPFFLNGIFLESPNKKNTIYSSKALIQIMILLTLLVQLPKLISQLQSFIKNDATSEDLKPTR